jgi:hypothetical protein
MSESSTAKVVEHFGQRTMVSLEKAHVQPEASIAQSPAIKIKMADFFLTFPPGTEREGFVSLPIKCKNIRYKCSLSPVFIGLKSVPDIFAGIHRE